VKNQPGVGDITKQYLYELSYKYFAKENNLSFNKNAFLMPTEDKEERIIGYAGMELFHELGDVKPNDIEVILMPSEEMYRLYLEATF
jgi:restriction endonuclease, type II, llaJI